MEFPTELKYASTDEWVRVEGNIATIGITDYAQDQLSDIVYFEALVDVGERVEPDTVLATVESVKSAGDVVSSFTGEVIEINDLLEDEPEIINSDPYEDGWMLKIRLMDMDELNELMGAAEYKDKCEE